MPTRNPYASGAAFPDLSPTINSFVDNLMRLKMHQEDIDLKGRQLTQDKEQFEVTSATSKFQLEEAKKKKAEMLKPMDITVHPMFLSLPDESKQEAMKFFSANQFTDERGVGTTESIMRGIDILEKSKPLFQTVMGPVVKAKQAAVTAAWDEFQQAQATQDPKKIQTAKAKYDQAYLSYGNSLGKFDEHMKLLDQQEQARELKQMEIDARRSEETWGPETPGPEGTTRQKSSRGQLKTVHTPAKLERPISVAPGASLVSPRGGAPIYTAPEKGPSDAEKRQTAKLIADAEGKILLNPGPESEGQADLFNQYAEKPYAYIWNENKGSFKGAKWDKVKLPKIKEGGRTIQVTAKDVWDSAHAEGISFEESLKYRLAGKPPVKTGPEVKDKRVSIDVNTKALIDEANRAVHAGANPDKVKKRLLDKYGITVK